MTFNIPLYDNLNNDVKGLIDSHILYDLISVDTRYNQDILLFELKMEMDLYNDHGSRFTYYKWICRRMRWMLWTFSPKGLIKKKVLRDNTTNLFKNTFKT
jgi:hypothetical protein